MRFWCSFHEAIGPFLTNRNHFVNSSDQVHAAFEYASNGDLRRYLRNNWEECVENYELPLTSESSLLQMAADVANGMAYLSRKEVFITLVFSFLLNYKKLVTPIAHNRKQDEM